MRQSSATWASKSSAGVLPADEERGEPARGSPSPDLQAAAGNGAYFQQIGTGRLRDAEEEAARANQSAAGKRAARALEQPCTEVHRREELEAQRAAGEAARQHMVEANLRLVA